MATTLHNLLTTVLFLTTALNYLATTMSQECPYPCYPPPIGPGNNPPVTTTPPAPPVSTTPPSTSFPPPVFTTPPAGGYSPFTPPSPYFASGITPPPPEPIIPWFPYYYRKPPHQDQSSVSVAPRGTSKAVIIIVLSFLLVSCFVLH